MHNTDMVDKLTNIYNDPSHYAGFYLSCNKSGSLGKHGDSHSEQNHGSIVAYMGQGGSLSIKEQIESLMRRHQNRVRQKTTHESSLRVKLELPYTSPFDDYEGVADVAA